MVFIARGVQQGGTAHAPRSRSRAGAVVQRRSWLRLSLLPELFWKLLNFLQFLCAQRSLLPAQPLTTPFSFTSIFTPDETQKRSGAIKAGAPAGGRKLGGAGSASGGVGGASLKNVRGISSFEASCAPGGG